MKAGRKSGLVSLVRSAAAAWQWLAGHWAPALIFLAFFAGTSVCQGFIYNHYKKPDFLRERIALLPEAKYMHVLGAGYEATIVDLLWIRGIQYYAQHFSTLCRPPEKGEGLVGLFHTICALDPDFIPGYKWGAFILTESMNDPELCPGGARRAIDEFLEPAMQRFPENVEFPTEAAFTAFWHVRDNDLAVKYFERAAAIPGAPPHLARMIPYVRSSEDSFPSLMFAYGRYYDIYEKSQTPSDKNIADKHLKRILTRFHLLHLKEAVRRYKEKTGHAPGSLADVVKEGLAPGVKTDEWPYHPALLQRIVAPEFENGLPIGENGEKYVYLPGADDVFILQERQSVQREYIEALNNLLAKFREKEGRCPENLEELVPDYLKEIPPDPLEMERRIDDLDCTVEIEVM